MKISGTLSEKAKPIRMVIVMLKCICGVLACSGGLPRVKNTRVESASRHDGRLRLVRPAAMNDALTRQLVER